MVYSNNRSSSINNTADGSRVQHISRHSKSFSSTQQNQQTARALEVSQSLADIIDREQNLVEDAQSALVVDLAKIVADEHEKRAEAATVARRHWWAQARESLLDLFRSVHSSNRDDQERGDGCADVDISIHAGGSATERPAATSSASLPLIRTCLDEWLRDEEMQVEKAATNFLTASMPMNTVEEEDHYTSRRRRINGTPMRYYSDARKLSKPLALARRPRQSGKPRRRI